MTTTPATLTLTLASGSVSDIDDIQAWLKAATELAKHEDPERFMPLTLAVVAEPQPEPIGKRLRFAHYPYRHLPALQCAMRAYFCREWQGQEAELLAFTDDCVCGGEYECDACENGKVRDGVATVTIARVVGVERETTVGHDDDPPHCEERWLVNVEVTP